MPPDVEQVDFAIITALEEERDAVLARLDDPRKLEKDGLDTHTYYEATVRSGRADGASYRVVVTSLASLGPIMASQKAQAVVARWHPRHVLLVGIACGISTKTNLGDVLVSTQIADSALGKVLDDGSREIRWTVHPAGPSLLDTALNLAPGEWVDFITERRPAEGQPVRHAGVIASGGDVISNAELIDSWNRQWAKLVGIEMEAGGVASGVLNTTERPEFLMIKGVSDHGEGKETVEAWRPYASDAAASFALALIRAGTGPTIKKRHPLLIVAIAVVVCAVVAIGAGVGWMRSARAAEVRRLNTNGVVALKNGENDQARRSFVEALNLDPGNAAAHAGLATLESNEGRQDEAVRHAELAVKAAPDVAVYHYNLGALLARIGRHDEALKSLDQAIRLEPTNVRAHNEIGNVYLALDRPADARKILSEGLQSDPMFPPLSKNLARAALAEDQPEEALRLLRNAPYPQNDWSGRAEVAYWLAVAETALQHRDASCAHLARVRELDPNQLTGIAPDAQRLAQSQGCESWR